MPSWLLSSYAVSPQLAGHKRMNALFGFALGVLVGYLARAPKRRLIPLAFVPAFVPVAPAVPGIWLDKMGVFGSASLPSASCTVPIAPPYVVF